MATVDAPPDWVEELAFPADGPPWLSMGLGRIDEPAWLLVDDDRDEQLALRRRLLAESHAEVFAARPGTEAAGTEVLDLVAGWIARHAPELIGDPADAIVSMHPLEAAGRIVQEDLVVMVPRDGGYHLDAACLCFPSHWRLEDKFEGSAAAIHGPVPRYADDLEARVDRYLDRLRVGTISARRNWSLHDRPDLFAPVPPSPRTIGPGELATGLWLRSERQTLRRLPDTGAVLFTIRVQQAPFGVLARRPEAAARLAARIRAQPHELTEMNGVTPYRPEILDWLDAVSG